MCIILIDQRLRKVNIFVRKNLIRLLKTNSGNKSQQIYPIIWCDKVPQLLLSQTSSFKLSRAYYSPLGTNKPFFFLDKLDSTKTGLRFIISIFGYSKQSPSVSLLVKLFVAEYNPKKGMPLSPAIEDKLMMPLFLPLVFILWISFDVKTAMDTQLIFATSITFLCMISVWRPTKLVPTLLINKQISRPYSCASIAYISSFFEESSKLKVIVLRLLFLIRSFCISLRISNVELNFQGFLEMRTILKPILTKTLQKPSPIPSVAPVTTAQLSLSSWQYLFFRSGIGRIQCLTTALTRKTTNLKIGYPRRRISIRPLLKIHHGN